MITLPADVPKSAQKQFKENYSILTKETDKLFLFAADHKIEHLHKDFIGDQVHPDAQRPEHLFNIASKGMQSAFAPNFGLIMRYGNQYSGINYVAKLNGKTDLITIEQRDPYSKQLWSVDDIMLIKKETKINICGIGFTLYLGSEFESTMLHEAAQAVFKAHQYGLIAILWIYPRGKSVAIKSLQELIPGACGVANALGADFVKISFGTATLKEQHQILPSAVKAAGNTGVICAGGRACTTQELLETIRTQLSLGARGCAVGRNIFQRSEEQAIVLANEIASLVYYAKTNK